MDAAEVVVVPDDPVAVVAQVEAKVETRTVEDVGPMAHGDLPAANRYRRKRVMSNSTRPWECSKCIPMATVSYAALKTLTRVSDLTPLFREP